jgi:hypothetical protein
MKEGEWRRRVISLINYPPSFKLAKPVFPSSILFVGSIGSIWI